MFLAGCSDGRPRRVPVSGQVLIDGQPLSAGFVRVIPSNARPATGTIDQQGRFRLTTFEKGDGCVAGTHRMEVVAFEILSPTEIRWLAPPKYRQMNTSGLSVTIDGPTDSLTVELTWAGGHPYVERSDTRGDSVP